MDVRPDSPAYRSGIRKDDKITSLDGEGIGLRGAYNALAGKRKGAMLDVTIERGGQEMAVTSSLESALATSTAK